MNINLKMRDLLLKHNARNSIKVILENGAKYVVIANNLVVNGVTYGHFLSYHSIENGILYHVIANSKNNTKRCVKLGKISTIEV
jgi:hypothetical protein